MEEDESQKIYDPTPRKLEEARKKGDVPKSIDVSTTVILIVSFGVMLMIGGKIAREISNYSKMFIERPHAFFN